LIDIYHYLQAQGVFGRCVHVYPPRVTGDDPSMSFQRLSRDGLRGILIPNRPAACPVRSYPSSLPPDVRDNVPFQEGGENEQPGRDDNWVSGYGIFRGGVLLERVGRETFYFDHSAGADPALRYEVRTVDGAGNVSAPAAASPRGERRAAVFDDAPGGGIAYTG